MTSSAPPAYIHHNTPVVVNAPGVILEIHTPVSSFAIPHSLSHENLELLFGKLSRKVNTGSDGTRVGPGWLKYEWNDTVWNLDDDSDYAIFVWRQNGHANGLVNGLASTSASSPPPPTNTNPTLHFRNPAVPVPTPPDYRNPSYYLFRPNPSMDSLSPLHRSTSTKSRTRSKSPSPASLLSKHQQDFMKFQSGNGVRTVMGKVGPVEGVRMLLKNGYRHVYMARSFAMKHGFVPKDATLGRYGYSGLVNIGQWPLTLGRTTTTHVVYLSEETHFDVILGRSFMEKRGIKTDPLDMTNIVCMDTGEALECEVVILRDGNGDFITVT